MSACFVGFGGALASISRPSTLHDLNKPQLSSTDVEREADLKQANGKLYTVESSLWEKSCPAVANGAASSVVRWAS
jgi:hypothetical protein